MFQFLILQHKKELLKNYNHSDKGTYQVIDNPTDVNNKFTEINKKEIVQHRNNLLSHYPKEYSLRELTQIYSFTGVKIIQVSSEQNPTQSTDMQPIQKQLVK